MTDDLAPNREPTGYTIDGVPWEEPRGPHLPDVITKVPLRVWPFLALAAVVGYDRFSEIASVPSLDPGSVLQSVPAALPSVVIPLLGAAYFASHRRLSLRSPMAIALTLLAVAQALRIVERPIIEFVGSVVLPSDDPFAAIKRSGFFFSVVSTVQAAAFICLLVGLRSARHRASVPGQRIWTVVVFGIAVATIAFGLQMIDFASQANGDGILSTNLTSWLVSAVATVATAAVSAELLAGARAGERPAMAWRAAAAAVTLILVSALPSWVIFSFSSQLRGLQGVVTWTSFLAEAVAFALLFGAFLLGLPSEDSDLPTQ